MSRAFVFASLLLSTTPVSAAGLAPSSPAKVGAELVSGLMLLTGVLIGICVAAAWFSRRLGKLPALSTSQPFRLIDSTPLANGQMLHLVEVGQVQLAITMNDELLESMCLVTGSFSEALRARDAG